MTIGPGSTIGIIGGGQLGRMLSVAAAQLGYRTHIFDPHEHPCAADVSAHFTRASFGDALALRWFGSQVDVVTYEFENLAVEPLASLEGKLRPGTHSLAITQDRTAEKAFLEQCGARVAPWRPIDSLADVTAAVLKVGLPLVLKTRRYGYDGKGQAWVHGRREEQSAWTAIAEEPAIAEAAIDFTGEFSVIIARWDDGRHIFRDSPENEHREGILR